MENPLYLDDVVVESEGPDEGDTGGLDNDVMEWSGFDRIEYNRFNEE